ncbi:MAG: 50S ribosomal protein L24 [Candidatus Levybacteria bacterium]|nr:50S ribosomal protein L24 [Candidatus Levybacteria bacterium]
MNTLKIKKGDTVQVMIGKDKGKKGEVMKVLPSKSMVLVENVNQYKRHIKGRQQGQKSEIVIITKPLHVSKVSLIDPKKKKPTRAGYKIVKGTKERIGKLSGEKI